MAKNLKEDLDQYEEKFDSSPIEQELNNYENQRIQSETPEDRNLGQLYKGLKHVSLLGKPAAMIATPVLEAARAPLKYIAENVGENTSQTPDINAYAEFDSVYPSDRATTTNILTDLANAMGIKTGNIGKVESEDYPKAAQFATNMTNPYNIGGALMDVALANKIPTPEIPASDKSKMALNYLRAKAKDKAMLLKMEESGKVQDVASMMANDPKNYIRPFSSDKTLDFIDGPIVTTKTADSSITSSARDTSKGKMGQLLESQAQAVEQVPQTHIVPKGDLAIAAKANLQQQGLLPTQLSAAEKMIDDIINVIQPSSDKIKLIKRVEDANADILRTSQEISDEVVGRVLDLGQAKQSQTQRLQSIPEEIANPAFVGTGGGPRVPNPEYQTVFDDVSQQLQKIDGEIAELQAGKVPAGKKYSGLYKLKKQKKALEEFYYTNLDDSAITVDQYMDFIDKQNLKPIGYADTIRKQGNRLQTTVGLEAPQEMGASQAAGRGLEYAGRQAQQTAMDMAPKVDSDLFNIRNKEIANNIAVRDLMSRQRVSDQNKFNVPVMDMARGVARQAIDLYPEYIAPYASKASDVARRTGTQAMKVAKYPLPMQLIEYQIPRDSNKILANKDVVLAKIAQMSNNPELTAMFQDALEKHPEKLTKVLPALVLQFPDLFEDDDYNRVDGKIFDPMLKQKALNDIRNSRKYSTREKAQLSKRLEMEGILDQ